MSKQRLIIGGDHFQRLAIALTDLARLGNVLNIRSKELTVGGKM